jgi:hypothetical protein
MSARSTRSETEVPETSGDGGERAERIRAYGREVRREGEAFLHATQGMMGEAEDLVRDQLAFRPYAVLGTAFGFGMFLGGGLPFGVVRFGARTMAGVAFRQLVAAALPPGAPR